MRGCLSVTTFADLVEETLAHLHGYTEHTEQATTLVDAIAVTTGGGTYHVTGASAVNKGYVEVDSELIYLDSVDNNANTMTVAAWGRAQQGSTAVTHSAGAKVGKAPRFPRHRVKRTLNEVIGSLYPSLFAVRNDESNIVDTTIYTYPLPATAQRVRDIFWESPAVTDSWIPVERWRMDTTPHLASFPTGRAVAIWDGMTAGQTIKVTYEAVPIVLVNDSDDFTTVSGLPESASDLVALGAAYRLITGTELSRTQPNTMEQSERSTIILGGTANNASKYLFGLFQQRLQQERDKLLALYPPRLVRTW